MILMILKHLFLLYILPVQNLSLESSKCFRDDLMLVILLIEGRAQTLSHKLLNKYLMAGELLK